MEEIFNSTETFGANSMEARMEQQESHIAKSLAVFGEGPGRLAAVVAGLPNQVLDHSQDGNSWTVRQIVHHLADGLDLWKGFVKQAIGAPGGSFSLAWYWEIPQDDWARKWAYAERPIASALTLYQACNRQVVELLEHSPGAWENCLIVQLPNREAQSVSVGEVVEMQTRHFIGHIDEIIRTVTADNLQSGQL